MEIHRLTYQPEVDVGPEYAQKYQVKLADFELLNVFYTRTKKKISRSALRRSFKLPVILSKLWIHAVGY